jgi:ATP-dependent helicase HrpB
VPKFEPSTGLTRLETERVSRASADQRAGRAGRTEPGVAIRPWRAEQTAALPAFTQPEIKEADLSGLLLDCAAFGVADPATLAFLDPPPAPALTEARALLTDLHALDRNGRLTASGAAMRKLALPVRLAHMVAEAATRGEAHRAAMLAVLLTERGLGGDSADLERRFDRFATDRSPRANAARQLAGRLAKQADDASPRSGQLASRPPACRRLAGSCGQGARRARPLRPRQWPWRDARPDRSSGRRALPRHRRFAGQGANARVASAAPINEVEIREALGDRIETHTETSFDPTRRTVRVRETTRLGAIQLGERMLPAPTGADADKAVIDALREHGLDLLSWGKDGSALRHRLSWLHQGLGAPWPAMSDAALIEKLDDWLLPFLSGEANLNRIPESALRDGLLSLVPHDLQRKVEMLAPTHFDAPSGSRLPIDYDGENPVLSIRVQELFGLDRHPAIANGAVPLTLELLSPAHRPIQTTRDLPGFWRGSWADVRSDMRGRYPKHVWPEGPVNAAATSRAKPRGT